METASSIYRRRNRKNRGGQTVNTPIDTLEGLRGYARSEGFEKEAEKAGSPKLSLLQRVGRGLMAFETGNSFYHERYDNASFGKQYLKDITTGLKQAVTGRIAEGEEPKKTFKDIMVKEGMVDRPGKFDPVDAAGLVSDILFDPTTWFGSAIGKGVVKGATVSTKIAKKTPVIGKPLMAVEEGAKALFKPFHTIEKLGDVGKKYKDTYLKYARSMRVDMNDWLGDQAIRAKGLRKSIGKKAFKKYAQGGGITEAIETSVKTGDKLVDEAMQAIIDGQKSIAKQEASRGILKSQLQDYMHHMLTPEAAAFITQKGDISSIFNPIRVRLGAAKQRGKVGTVKEINKEFNKKYGFNLFEEDAFKAFAKRGIDSIKALRTYDFLERIGNQFGRKAKVVGSKVKGGKKILEYQDELIDEYGVLWKKSSVSGSKHTPYELKNTLFPSQIADHIDEINKVFSNDKTTNQIIKYYDKALAYFKGFVTGYFPAFHTRNATGGLFNNWIAGLKDPSLYLETGKILKKGSKGFITKKDGSKLSYETIRQLIKENGVVGQTGYLDVAQFLQKEVEPTIKSRILKSPQIVMGFIEDHLRVPLFVDGLKKGLDPAQAGRRVIQYHFDYMPEGFTAFEKNIMKRVIPFYTWTRHNIPLQIEQVVKKPGKYAGVFKVQKSWGVEPSSEEEGVLPIWLRERFTVKSEGGYWSGAGIPLEEATEKLSSPLRGFAISMSPFLKVPMEQITGFNIFKGMKIDEDRYGKYYKNMPAPIKRFLKLKKHVSGTGKKYYTVDPKRKYWVETIGMRGWNTATRLANHVDDRRNLLSLATTIKKYDYTFEDMKKWSDFDKRKELEQALIRAGKLSEFRKTYIPKK